MATLWNATHIIRRGCCYLTDTQSNTSLQVFDVDSIHMLCIYFVMRNNYEEL